MNILDKLHLGFNFLSIFMKIASKNGGAFKPISFPNGRSKAEFKNSNNSLGINTSIKEAALTFAKVKKMTQKNGIGEWKWKDADD